MTNKRLETVMAIWVAFGAASVFTFTGDTTNSNDIVLAVIFALAAVMGTGMVMYGSPDQESKAAARSRKLKNDEGALLDRLVESMSEEELEALRNRLTLKVGEDGELVTGLGQAETEQHHSRR
jgi:hypothetical protein